MVDDLTTARRRGALSPLHLARGVPAAARCRHGPPSPACRTGGASGLIDEEEYDGAMRGEERLRRGRGGSAAAGLQPERARTGSCCARSSESSSKPPSAHLNYCSVMTYRQLRSPALAPEAFDGLSAEEVSFLESRVRYEGYIRREKERLERLKPFESRAIPRDFAYEAIPGLSREVVEKCARRSDPGRSARPRGFPASRRPPSR